MILLIFGGRKLPELGKQLGSAISNFRATVRGKDEYSEEGGSEKKKD